MKLSRTSMLAIAALAAAGLPIRYTSTDKKAERNLKIGRAM
jgi:hypothetical protein